MKKVKCPTCGQKTEHKIVDKILYRRNIVSFKKFLTDECFDEKKYGDGKYDVKIYNWFHND